MVIPADRHAFAPAIAEQVAVVPEIQEVPADYERKCPRCEAQLRLNYEELVCLQCGFVDYDYVPPRARRKKKTVISDGTRYVLRYVGDFESLSQTLTQVQLQRMRNRVVYSVSCPFCSKPMIQSSLSGKRREVREERYKCIDGHRVSLTPAKNGSLGWK